ncbi:hypothetical protein [Mucilaginibacter agri]|uniref:Uncharacterized protein n=1 Tax=Mucilaginibacter agri TaxID=2695265 RepID=A0A966DQR1_9SPHI|nr:hypothetical protein [Mucilaginibacter agri]NCD68258.1 hypothetical protein [Mucilaginibacter agri]
MENIPIFSDANRMLSFKAIEYASNLALLGVKNIGTRLYLYGRIPISPDWLLQFPQSKTLYEAIIVNNQNAAELLTSQWIEKQAPIHNDRWTIFLNKNWERKSFSSAPYKLYVNLHPDSILDEFNTVVNHFATFDVPIFKFSKDVFNLLRPDKIVAYLMDFNTLITLGKALSVALKSAKVQPLPFTAAFDESGVVSCGFDPPAKLTQSFAATSWRSVITELIARALSEGYRSNMARKELVQNVNFKLDAIGIDTEKWLPKVFYNL